MCLLSRDMWNHKYQQGSFECRDTCSLSIILLFRLFFPFATDEPKYLLFSKKQSERRNESSRFLINGREKLKGNTVISEGVVRFEAVDFRV